MNRRNTVLFVTLLPLTILLAGCFQQAGDAFQPVSITIAPVEGPAQGAPTTEPLPMDVTSPGITTEAPTIEAPTAVEPTVAAPTTEPPPVNNTAGGLSSVDATPTFSIAITIISPTRDVPSPATAENAGVSPETTVTTPEGQFVTPSNPLGPVTQEAIIPLGSVSATPSGLITPTALGEPNPAATPAPGGSQGGTESGANVPAECIYVVQRGDTLFRIASRNNTTVADLRKANPEITGDIIQPAQELVIPGCGVEQPSVNVPAAEPTTAVSVPPGGTTYAVKSGDTLFTIAQRYGITVQAIVDANKLSNPNRLDVGQELIIPAPAS